MADKSAADLAVVRQGPAIKPPDGPQQAEVIPPQPTLAEQINQEHDATRRSLAESIRHAIACGELLILAKENAKAEGKKWPDWLEANTNVPQTTASLYMRFAEHKNIISNAVAKTPDLSIRNAIKLLPKAAPRGGIRGQPKTTQTSTTATPTTAPANPSTETQAPEATSDPAAPRNLVAEAKAIVDQLDKQALEELGKYVTAKAKAYRAAA